MHETYIGRIDLLLSHRHSIGKSSFEQLLRNLLLTVANSDTPSFAKIVGNRYPRWPPSPWLEAQVGQKLLTWIRLIMICYIVPWWPSWLSDQNAFSNSESDVVWRVSREPPWPPSWILELNDPAILNLHVTLMPPSSFGSTWQPVWEEMRFEEFQDGGRLGPWNRTILAIWISITPECLPSCLSSIRLTVR